VFFCFSHDRCSYSFPSLFSIVPFLLLGSQHSTARHLSFLVFWAMLHFYLGPFPCACPRTKARGKNEDCEIIPPVAHRCSMHWLLSVHLLPFFSIFFFLAQRCRYLVSHFGNNAQTFARKKERKREKDRTLILNPLTRSSNLYRELFFRSFVSLQCQMFRAFGTLLS